MADTKRETAEVGEANVFREAAFLQRGSDWRRATSNPRRIITAISLAWTYVLSLFSLTISSTSTTNFGGIDDGDDDDGEEEEEEEGIWPQ